MPRQVYKYIKGKGLVPIEEVETQQLHYVITDDIPPTRHPVDNKIYTSKNKFRDSTRRHNCIEVGNDLISKQKKRVAPPVTNSHSLNKFLWDHIDMATNKKR